MWVGGSQSPPLPLLGHLGCLEGKSGSEVTQMHAPPPPPPPPPPEAELFCHTWGPEVPWSTGTLREAPSLCLPSTTSPNHGESLN